MTEERLDIVLKLQDRATATLKRVGARFLRFGSTVRGSVSRMSSAFLSLKGFIIGAFIGTGILRAIKGFTKASGIQEEAISDLNAAMKAAGIFSEQLTKRFQDQASALQRQTTFGDEAIISMQALLLTYGVTGDKLEETTKATLDFAAATGSDLKTAAALMGKAATGMTSSLSRYGIVVDTKGLPASEAFEKVLVKMNEQFGGRAAAKVNTFTGGMTQFQNAIGDVGEKIGDTITKSEKFRATMTVLTDRALDFADSFVTGKSALNDILPSFEQVVKSIIFVGKTMATAKFIFLTAFDFIKNGATVLALTVENAFFGLKKVLGNISAFIVDTLGDITSGLASQLEELSVLLSKIPGFKGLGAQLGGAVAQMNVFAAAAKFAAKQTKEALGEEGVEAANKLRMAIDEAAGAGERANKRFGELQQTLGKLTVAGDSFIEDVNNQEIAIRKRTEAQKKAGEQIQATVKTQEISAKKAESTVAALGKTIQQTLTQGVGDAFTSALTKAQSAADAIRGILGNIASQIQQQLIGRIAGSLVGGLFGAPAIAHTGGMILPNGRVGRRFQAGGGVPIIAEPGEFIVRKAAAQGNMNMLRNLNETGQSGGGDVTIVNSFDPKMIQDQILAAKDVILNMVSSDIRQNGLLRTTIQRFAR